ncbi:phage minor capsid protein [Streptomyces mobaraensis]|uniref:Phage capsid protein n=1 Tax=Streptomyces mobaraensis TaxID=35621 RepID=A0A5N5W0I7_STRMB|nr:phage minor capsid protein [Streptomyces mobaraensis]KAB7834059.1 phage capsid protein [Streptomyces mobaraensis]
MVEDLSAGVRDLYADAEQRLLGVIARQLADGFEAPGWATAKLRDVQVLRRAAQGVVDALGSAMRLEVFDAVAEAYNTGTRAGLVELGALAGDDARRIAESTPNTQAVDRLAHETVDLVEQTHRGILRGVEDGYRQVVSEVAATPLLGAGTRRAATQDAMTRFADRGLRTFVDRSGRSWSMTSYAEMAVRTATGRAAVEAHSDRLRAAGIDLVIVSSSPRECPLCRPWERAVLSIGGPDGARTVDVEHATEDGRMVQVHVAGSLDEARRAGLQHPNCRHSVSSYTPGVTRTDDAEPDPAGYDAGQRQRAIERNIRKYKQRTAAAVTPEGKRAAEAKVRQWQGAMRDHLAAHPDLRRLRHREQPGASNLPGPQSRPGEDMVQAARVRSGDERTLSEMGDEQLVAAVRTGVLDDPDHVRVAAEVDRRYPVTPPPAATGGTVADYAANRGALDEALGPVRLDGPPPADPDEWGAYGRDIERGPDGTGAMSAAERWAYERELADRMAQTAYNRDEIREMYREHIHLQWLAAEDATRGHMLTREAEAAGVDPRSLFSGPAHVAYARASEDLIRFWDEVSPRVTLAEFSEQVTGVANSAAETARHAAHDQRRKR